MPIEGFNSRWDYIGDNIVTSFPFDNLVVKDTDLRVYLDNVLQTITVDYTVTGAGTKAGTVDFLIAPAAAVAVAIVRKTARDQLTAYPTNGPFPAKSHEAAMDKLTIIVQEDEEDHNRLIQYSESSLVGGMPIADPVADAILAYAPDGLSIINGPSVQDIFDSEAAAAASEAAAAVSAAAAASSELAAALSAAQLSGTSVTNVAVGVGAKVFETQAGKFFDAGTFLLVFSDADPTQFMAGQVASYVGTTLTLNINQFEGAGSFADWNIQVSGGFGVDGAQAPRTVIIVTADLDISAGFTHNTFFQVRPVAEALVTITIPDATTAGFIDGYEGTFHLDIAGSILVKTPSTPPVTDIDGSADLVIADPGKAVTLIASTTTGDWQISQDNRPTEVTGVTVFPTTSADPLIAGYNAGVTDNDDVRYDDPSVTITTPVITNSALDRATAEQLFAFITDAGVITDLLDNDLIITVVLNKTPSNARDVRVFTSLFIRDSGGVETLIKETATSGLVTDAPTEQNLIFSNVTADISATDRIVVKAFGFKDVAGGTNPAVQSTLGGKLPSDTPARLKVPQSLTSVSHNATTGLQGGGPGEYYHLKAAEIAALSGGGSFLSVVGANLSLAPKNGNTVKDGAGNVLTINSAPVTLAIGAAVASTWYYIYGSATAGTIDALEFSATVPVTASNGVKHKTGDTASVLLGWTQTTSVPAWDANFTYSQFNELEQPSLHVRDEKANTTDGGTNAAATWNTRTLNTVKHNTIFGASVTSNQITLPVAPYDIDASAPAENINKHKTALYNTSDAAFEVIGTSEHAIAPNAGTRSFTFGRFSIAATKVFEFRHYTETAVPNTGLGPSSDSGQIEVYAEVKIRKVA